MKFLLATILSAASLVAAAPAEKRADSCGLDVWQAAGQRAVMHNLFYLDGVTSDGDPQVADVIWGTPGQTDMISCTGKTGVWLSVDPGFNNNLRVAFDPSDLGHQLDGLYHQCYGGPPADSDTPIRAFQYWGNGYNLLVAGNAPC